MQLIYMRMRASLVSPAKKFVIYWKGMCFSIFYLCLPYGRIILSSCHFFQSKPDQVFRQIYKTILQ